MESGSADTLPDLVAMMPSPEVARRWKEYVKKHVETFAGVLARLPMDPGPGSMSTGEAFWLYQLVHELRPRVLIDSGSATGWSAHVMAAAAPEATVCCCDPYREPDGLPESAEYYGQDWTKIKRKWPDGTFALFDDHVNQRRRALQARRAGISNVVFHDVYRVPTKSTISLVFGDLVGLADRVHTFDPLWFEHPMFTDMSQNPQMYRWLTWVRLTPHPGFAPAPRLRAVVQRRRLRNPGAEAHSRLNWRARG